MKKKNHLNQLNTGLNFWLFAGLLCILLVSIMARDIDRPFYGLHSWGEAGGAWKARCYLKYDLKYTKGFSVWAVGEPPGDNPNRALDHPQLGRLLPAVDMAIWGMNEKGLRIGGIVRAVVGLLLFLMILRKLFDEKVTLLAGLLYALFPITGYFANGLFGEIGWDYPLSYLAILCYLTITDSLKQGLIPKKIYYWLLGASLFFALQISWCGFFFAVAIGVSYVSSCIYHRKLPKPTLLLILIIAPLASLLLNFVIMAAGHNWQWSKIWALYQWRSTKGEMQEFIWAQWFARMWKYAVTNFTMPILITAISYLTFGQLLVFRQFGQGKRRRVFRQFWLFALPACLQMFILKGSRWQHQFWEAPFIPVMALTAAIGIMLVGDIAGKINRNLGRMVIIGLIAMMCVSCVKGLNYYYSIRWQAPAKIEMLKMLNEKIPANKALLSFENFTINQHPVKGPHYRPEIAWYLDREIEPAQSIDDIKQKAATGQYPFYLLPTIGHNKKTTLHLQQLRNGLEKRYKLFTYVPGQPPKQTKDGKFLRAGMPAYMIFDLNSRIALHR